MSMQVIWSEQPLSGNGAALRGAEINRVGIGHALVDDLSFDQVCTAIVDHACRNGRPAYVITPNAQHIVLLQKNPAFRKIYHEADLVIPDGISLLFAARFYGRLLQERVTGVDLFVKLCSHAARQGLRVFLLGGRPGSAELAAGALKKSFPALQCETYCPPYEFEKSAAGLKAAADAVTAYQPHLLFVGLGAPKQEQWIHDHGLHLSVPVCLGIGGSFEIVGGVIARAPEWVQKMACEWVYRLCEEPRRLWRRYLIGNLEFAGIVMQQRARRALLNTCVRLAHKEAFGAELEEIILLRKGMPPHIMHALEPRAKAAPDFAAIQ
jgi:N-acetylglucosaminyldiphosphoundecaprenol N-acetyl-beta-D-mannosaminyltransferase